MNAVELARWRNRPDRPRFSAPGRLARVGLPARLVDAGLVTSLLLRGRVPGGTAAAAERRYAPIRERDPRVSYHGRVVRTEGWVVLHYLFFYAMNDWRSTFDGANDHEADWEQCFIVLEELADGTTEPAWFCAAAHDEKGDDLRRRWDDPRLETLDGHPIVYPGAGSHATYLERGEYIMRLPFPGEQNLRGPLDLLRHVWRDTLAQPDPGDLAGQGRPGAQRPVRRLRPRRRLAVGPGRRDRVDADPRRRRRIRGSTATAACGASTPATGSRASARRPGRSTRGPGPSASRGPTRSGSPGSPRSRRRPARRPSSPPGSRSSRPSATVRREAEADRGGAAAGAQRGGRLVARRGRPGALRRRAPGLDARRRRRSSRRCGRGTSS